MELLSLGKLDKGATASAEKYKSRNERWFNQKQKKPSKEEVTDGIEYLYIWRDSLVQVRYRRGSAETVECYRVLAFFTKYYNKWFVSVGDESAWVNNASKKINAKVLGRLVTRTGGTFLDVRLEKDGDWGPQHVFSTVNSDDIVKMENYLVKM